MVEERADGLVVFNQPAGHLEPGESLLDAARRETLEETGWHVTLENFLGLYHYQSGNNCYIRSCFIASAVEQDEAGELDQDIIAVHWLTLDEIRKRQEQLRSPVVLRVLEDYLAGTRFPLQLITTIS